MTEDGARSVLVKHGHSLFIRGYSCGSSGNLSVRLENGGFLMTPTNVSLGSLEEERLSLLDAEGRHLDGDPPTKEAWLHMAMYRSRPTDNAVVHLHSTYAVALSCRTDRNPSDALPPITPYVVMRVGPVALLPYSRPGDAAAGEDVERAARVHRSILLGSHGPAVAGPDLDAAVSASEELEETARLFFILEGRPQRTLDGSQVDELRRIFDP